MSTSRTFCKQEEVVPITEIVWKSIIRDKAKFTQFSPKTYSELFYTTTEKSINDLKIWVQPMVMEAESKKMTANVNQMMEDLRPKLNSLESYVNKAGNSITAAPADFRFIAIREAISAHNKEGVILLLKTMMQLVERNLLPIQEQGFTADAKAGLEADLNKLESQGVQKGQQIQDTSKAVKLYNKELKTLLSQIKAICKDGKIIFAESAPEKVKDYTFTQLLKLVRAEASNKTGTNGSATSTDVK